MKTISKSLPLMFLLILILVTGYGVYFNDYIKLIFNNFYFTILPILAPNILLDCLFVNSGGIKLINSWFKNKNNIYLKITIIIIGLIGGSTSLAYYVNTLINQNILNKKEGQLMIESFMLPSLPFIINVVLIKFSNVLIIFFIILLYVIPFIIFILKNRKLNHICNQIDFDSTNNQMFISDSIIQTNKTLIIVIGSIILFNLPYLIIVKFFHLNDLFFLQSLIEFSNGILNLTNNLNTMNILYIMFILTFNSFSIYLQTKVIAPFVDTFKLIKTRLILALFNTIIIYLIL